MLVQIPTTSAKLFDLLSAAQKAQVANNFQRQDGRYTVQILNTGANNVFLEIGAAATTTGSHTINATNGNHQFQTDNLNAPQFIAATAATDVRITIF